MREICELKNSFSQNKQPPFLQFKQENPDSLKWSRRDPLRRVFARTIAVPALRLSKNRIQQALGFELSFPHHLLCMEERFAEDASLSTLLQQTRGDVIRSVLVPGSSVVGEDAQFWLRRGIRKLAIADILERGKAWKSVSARIREYFRAETLFRHCSIESTPFEDASFDLISSNAVLEHVRNLAVFCQETARILRPGGWAWHTFGPLYFTFGGDHCITAYGKKSGYDHLLLDEKTYRRKIADEEYYRQHADPAHRFWALFDQFSYATASEYLRYFSQHFEICHVVVKISGEGLRFRKLYPDLWKQLTSQGLSEEALLVKGLVVLLRKK